MTNGRTTNDKIFELVNSTRLEIKSDLGDVRRHLEALESGRIATLETKMNNFELAQTRRDAVMDKNQAVLSTKFVIVAGIIITILTALLNGLFTRIFTK